jgi:predicted transcriptional regulator
MLTPYSFKILISNSSTSPTNPINTISYSEDILSLLAYFDIFKHPLTVSDIHRMKGLSEAIILEQLKVLVTMNICFEWQGFYGLSADIQENAQRRLVAEKNAEQYWSKVKKVFPTNC